MPMVVALTAVATVWALGCVWSFTEQRAFAGAKGFADPALLPLVIDGLAAAMGGVAYAASLDARPAVPARLGTALAVLASATSNGVWAAERSTPASAGPGSLVPASPDLATIAVGVGIPIAANIAFEVLLAELRRQVQRRRGLPAPPPLPPLRLVRLLLAPRSTFQQWRAEVLDATEIGPHLRVHGCESSAGVAQRRDPIRWSSTHDLGLEDPTDGGAQLSRATSDGQLGTEGVPLPEAAPGADAPGTPSDVDHEPPEHDDHRNERREPEDPASKVAAPAAVSAKPGADDQPQQGDRDSGAADGQVVGESNLQVWRLAEHMIAVESAAGGGTRTGDAESESQIEAWTGASVGTLLGGSARQGQRLLRRALALVESLRGPEPLSPPPGLEEIPPLPLPAPATPPVEDIDAASVDTAGDASGADSMDEPPAGCLQLVARTR